MQVQDAADRLYAADDHASARPCNRVPLEPVLSRANDPAGSALSPFTFLYGMRTFIPLCAVLVGGGVVVALYFPKSFSLGGWIGGAALLIFACILRASVHTELRSEG